MTASGSTDPDWAVRLAAFSALSELVRVHGSVLPWRTLEGGFVAGGRHFRFANQTKGIFRPAGMVGAALSLKTTVPRQGPPRYDDIAGHGAFLYSLQRRGIDYHDNRLLLLARELRTPVIYLYGVRPGYYRPLWPAFVVDFDPTEHQVSVVIDDPDELYAPGSHVADASAAALVRRYSTVLAKKRLHQEVFRHLVLEAYDDRCTVCRLPRRELLQAAHIEPDADVRGDPVVSNGLALCSLHHDAYDANLLGVREDHVIQIAPSLIAAKDGPTLEHALKAFDGQKIHLPRRSADRPAPERLLARYEQFRRSA